MMDDINPELYRLAEEAKPHREARLKRLARLKHSCGYCGEFIPNPTFLENGVLVCQHCCTKSTIGTPNSSVERTDIDYHGGRFHSGEW